MAKTSGNNRYLRRSGGGGLPGRASMGGGGNQNALAQAQEMLAKAQAELAATSVEGTAGGGAVRVTMSGEQKIVAINLQPEVVDPGRCGDAPGPDHGRHRRCGGARRGTPAAIIRCYHRRPRLARPRPRLSIRPMAGTAATPEPIQRLVTAFHRLPGVGPKSAQRLAYHILAFQPGRGCRPRRSAPRCEAPDPLLLRLHEHH